MLVIHSIKPKNGREGEAVKARLEQTCTILSRFAFKASQSQTLILASYL